MPYRVKSICTNCQESDEFVIGLWTDHRGVYVCETCQQVVNIPLETGQCPGCGITPAIDEYFDYARSIPYLGGQFWGDTEIEPGPECPRCHNSPLSFDTYTHFNVGRLGSNKGGATPWFGIDTLEKAIFIYSAIPPCRELELDVFKVYRYYRLDMLQDKQLLVQRQLSLPIIFDIRSHLMALQMAEPEIFETLKPDSQINS